MKRDILVILFFSSSIFAQNFLPEDSGPKQMTADQIARIEKEEKVREETERKKKIEEAQENSARWNKTLEDNKSKVVPANPDKDYVMSPDGQQVEINGVIYRRDLSVNHLERNLQKDNNDYSNKNKETGLESKANDQ